MIQNHNFKVNFYDSKAFLSKFSPFKNDIKDHLLTEFELASNGPGGTLCGATLGRYELVPGEQINGSPVYMQAHSKEVPTRWRYKYKLHRWDEPLHLHPYLPRLHLLL